MQRSRLRTFVAGLTITALIALGSAIPASADDYSVVQNLGTGQCLHHNRSGTVRTVTSCSRTNGALQWHVHTLGTVDGRTARQVRSNNPLQPPFWCLDSNAEGDVYANECNGTNQFQMWEWIVQPNGVDNVVKNIRTGRCLGSPSNGSGRVNTVPCPDNDDYPYRWWRRLR